MAHAEGRQDLNLPLIFTTLRDRRLNDLKGKQLRRYPEVITRLPEADITFEGIRARILQSEKHQLVFFEMETSARVPEHCHDYDQWGFMLQGKMELTVNGEKRIVKKGDEYVIPAQAKHSARFLAKSRVIDFFSEKDRYKTKSP
jgi:quercetin dioxygenase-like cupin family protein